MKLSKIKDDLIVTIKEKHVMMDHYIYNVPPPNSFFNKLNYGEKKRFLLEYAIDKFEITSSNDYITRIKYIQGNKLLYIFKYGHKMK
jgi:hypothetical protein